MNYLTNFNTIKHNFPCEDEKIIKINQIYFIKRTKEEIENKCKNSIKEYDFSDYENNGFIKAWIEEKNNRNILYVASPEVIYFPSDSSFLFCPSNTLFNLNQLEKIEFDNINTSNVTNMDEMFSRLGNITYLDLSMFDTSNVTTMIDMFWLCESLKEINLTSFDTKNVEDMDGMFLECKHLQNIDLKNFDFSKVKDFDSTFAWLENITELDLSNLVKSTRDALFFHTFRGCKSLKKLDISNLEIDIKHYYEECDENNGINKYSNLFDCIPENIEIYVKNELEKENLKIISEGLLTDNNISVK